MQYITDTAEQRKELADFCLECNWSYQAISHSLRGCDAGNVIVETWKSSVRS